MESFEYIAFGVNEKYFERTCSNLVKKIRVLLLKNINVSGYGIFS